MYWIVSQYKNFNFLTYLIPKGIIFDFLAENVSFYVVDTVDQLVVTGEGARLAAVELSLLSAFPALPLPVILRRC